MGSYTNQRESNLHIFPGSFQLIRSSGISRFVYLNIGHIHVHDINGLFIFPEKLGSTLIEADRESCNDGGIC